jgi:hypothetical protein
MLVYVPNAAANEMLPFAFTKGISFPNAIPRPARNGPRTERRA